MVISTRMNKFRALSLSIVLLLSGCTGLLPNQVLDQSDSGADNKNGQSDGSGNNASNKSNAATDQTDNTRPIFSIPLKAVIATQPAKNALIVMDIEQGKAVGTIPVGNFPVGLALDKKSPGKYAYVANYGSNAVALVNLQSNSVEKYIEAGENPWAVGVNSAGSFLYAVNAGDNTVAVIDIAKRARTRKVIFSEWQSNFRAREIAINPAVADEAFVISDRNAGTATSPRGLIVQINSFSTRTLYEIGGANRLGKAAVTPDGKRLLITDHARPCLWSVNLSTGAAMAITIPAPGYDVVISPDGNAAYVSMPEINAVIGIDLATNTSGSPALTMSTGHLHYSPQILTLSADGSSLWFLAGGTGDIGRFSSVNGVTFAEKPKNMLGEPTAFLGNIVLTR